MTDNTSSESMLVLVRSIEFWDEIKQKSRGVKHGTWTPDQESRFLTIEMLFCLALGRFADAYPVIVQQLREKIPE